MNMSLTKRGLKNKRLLWGFEKVSLIALLFVMSAYSGFSNTAAEESKAALLSADIDLRGKVVDSKTGEPLAGVTVKVVENNKGTITDAAGAFSLSVPEDAKLEISFVGYNTQIVNVGGRNNILVRLESSSTGLDELVVVGYGTQKKENLTGAISQVGQEVFKNRSMTNISQGLQGEIPNLNINFSDGKPTRSPVFNIRGTTSIGQGGSALILIDGVEGDPTLLNPNDIKSVTVLKDAASSAIYGARGTFGVVLITTKDPEKGKMSINYNSIYSINKLTTSNDYVSDGYQWASMFRDSYYAWTDYTSIPQNVNKSMKFSDEYLKAIKDHLENPSLTKTEIDQETGRYIYFYNTDWYQELYKNSSFSHVQNLSISGSSDKAGYLISGRYQNRPGIFKYNSDKYESYNLRAKGEIRPFNWLKVVNNTSFSDVNYFNPIGINESNIWRAIQYDAPPMSPVYNPDGTFTNAAAYSIGSFIQGTNGIATKESNFSNLTSVTATFLNDKLHIKGDLSYSLTNSGNKQLRIPVDYSEALNSILTLGLDKNDILQGFDKTNYLAGNLYTDYSVNLGFHDFKILIGYNYETSKFESNSVSRNGLLFDEADNLNLAFGESITTGSNWQQWTVLGGFYRLNYSFKEKYLVELDGRYDGSSKFPSNQRFHFFPSISAGWRISEEAFWKDSRLGKIVEDLKIRGSYGSLGNGNIAPYMFEEIYNISRLNRILAGVRPQYTNQANVLPNGLTWETAKTSDLGVDFLLFQSRLSVTFDGYIRKTKGMYTKGVTLPAIFGAGSPKGNYADLETKGWELSTGWRDNFELGDKAFNYNIKVGLSNYGATITKYNNEDKRLTDFYEGEKIGEIWGFVTDGFFISDEDIAKSANQSLFPSSQGNKLLPGDIKFKDLNHDGVIDLGDNTVNSHGDQIVIGNSEPKYSFGINLDFNWNNFSLSTFFQGILKQDWYPDNNSAPFWGQYVAPYANVPQYQLGKIWSEDNVNAYFPRYRGYIALSSARSLGHPQTRYLQKAGYVRLKSFQIGYSLPESIIRELKLSQIQFYFSGENVFTYSPLYKLIGHQIDVENIRNADPDLGSGGGGGHAYPILKSISLGLNISF